MITAPNACPGRRIHSSVNLAKLNSVTRKAFVCSPGIVLGPRRIVAGLLPLTLGLEPMPVHVRFPVDTVSQGQCRSTTIPHTFIRLPQTQLASITRLRIAVYPIPVTARSKALVCGRSLAGIAGSNSAEGMAVFLLGVLLVVK